MINRRHDGRAPCLARQSLQQMLERKPQIYLPATCKGGHESGTNHTLGTHAEGPLGVVSGHSHWISERAKPIFLIDGSSGAKPLNFAS
jgi:hypothetical protein